MTREEAIQLIDEIASSYYPCDKKDALEMSILALEQEPCGDAISREDALMCMTGEFLPFELYKPEDIISKRVQRIKALPSVRPKIKTGHWISVNERLPEIIQNVLCQCRGNIYSVLRLNHNGDWECIYPHTTYMQSFVTAWMSLPEPYKPQESEDEQ